MTRPSTSRDLVAIVDDDSIKRGSRDTQSLRLLSIGLSTSRLRRATELMKVCGMFHNVLEWGAILVIEANEAGVRLMKLTYAE